MNPSDLLLTDEEILDIDQHIRSEGGGKYAKEMKAVAKSQLDKALDTSVTCPCCASDSGDDETSYSICGCCHGIGRVTLRELLERNF